MLIVETGRGVSHQHKASVYESDEAEFSVDYSFMTKEGQVEFGRNLEEQDKIGACPVLVGSDRRSKAVWAMVVNTKGPTESAVKWLVGNFDQAGCRGVKVVLKSDQKESIVALKKAVAIKRQGPHSEHRVTGERFTGQQKCRTSSQDMGSPDENLET